jgi:glycosyltransferase involved in cell wall biosynthesis
MYRDKTIAAIVPAYNEEKLIGKVLKTTPEFSNHIIMMDDASFNRNGEIVQAFRKEGPRIIYIRHQKNETFLWRLK